MLADAPPNWDAVLMANKSSREPSVDDPTGGTGTLPQQSAPPDAPTGLPRPPEFEKPIEVMEVELDAPTAEPPKRDSNAADAPKAGLPHEVSQPYVDGPTGTIVGTGSVTGPTTFGLPGKPTPNATPVDCRFEILDELAKGGMGQVSIALDRELDRQVALKEIQPRYAYDHAVTTRFMLEARVTGKLEHPGIVPVYGLNQHADGRPYYAMRFITGQSLQDAAKSFHAADKAERDPRERALALRQLLKRFVDVCNTIAFAHNRGILHRDLKPANVMLGAFGETLVVDWGLAKDTTAATKRIENTTVMPALSAERHTPTTSVSQVRTLAVSEPMESAEFDDGTRTGVQVAPPSTHGTPAVSDDSELTEVGKAMGTPAFMAPEQADGRWDDVGPAADIYSLGATLYAILAGKAPFRGETYEILEKVKRGDATPIHVHKPGVPAALVAICRKAMARQAADRYASALDLARDVERWLGDEPIDVYREPWTVRTARWARRHRNLVFGSAATLLTALVAITVGFFQVDAERSRTATAKKQTEDAYVLLKDEEKKVRDSYAKLQEEERKVRAARTVAERSREDARVALLALTDDAIGEILTSQHAATGKQKQFLESVVGMYHRFIQESTNVEDSHFFVAGAHFRVARLQFKLGHHEEAEAAFRQALDLANGETSAEWRQLRGETLLYSGIQRMARGALLEAEERFRAARQIFFELINEEIQAKRTPKPEQWHRLGQSEDRLGLALYSRGNAAEAEDWFRNSLANRRTLFELEPNVPEYEFRVAQSLRQIAMVCSADGRRLEALDLANQSREIMARLLKNDPTSAVFLVQLADIDNLLATAADTRTTPGGATAAARPIAKRIKDKFPPRPIANVVARSAAARHADDAVRNWTQLVNLYPADVGYRQQLATANLNLAVAEQKAGRYRQSAEALAALKIVLDDFERRFPVDTTSVLLRGRAAHTAAINHREQDELPAAERAARDAVAIAEGLLKDRPKNPRYQNDLAYYQVELATILLLCGENVPAETTLGEAWLHIETAAKSPGVSPSDANLWNAVRAYARTYADLLSELHRYDQVGVVAKRIEAIAIFPDAARFEIACLFGRAAILATRDDEIGLEAQKRYSFELAESALDRIAELERGFEWLNAIKSDPDLLAVRGLRDFGIVVREFRETAPAARTK
jgi:eukaryotic-like serine/threonine-protein kinase